MFSFGLDWLANNRAQLVWNKPSFIFLQDFRIQDCKSMHVKVSNSCHLAIQAHQVPGQIQATSAHAKEPVVEFQVFAKRSLEVFHKSIKKANVRLDECRSEVLPTCVGSKPTRSVSSPCLIRLLTVDTCLYLDGLRRIEKKPTVTSGQKVQKSPSQGSCSLSDRSVKSSVAGEEQWVSYHFIYFKRFAALHSHYPQVILQGAIRGVSVLSVLQLSSLGPQPTWAEGGQSDRPSAKRSHRFGFSSTSLHGNIWDNSSVLAPASWKIFAKDVRDAVRSAYLRISSQSVFQICWEGSLMIYFSWCFKACFKSLVQFRDKMFHQNKKVLGVFEEATHGDTGKNCQVHRGRMPLKTRSLQRVRAPRSSTGADSVSKSIWSFGLPSLAEAV